MTKSMPNWSRCYKINHDGSSRCLLRSQVLQPEYVDTFVLSSFIWMVRMNHKAHGDRRISGGEMERNGIQITRKVELDWRWLCTSSYPFWRDGNEWISQWIQIHDMVNEGDMFMFWCLDTNVMTGRYVAALGWNMPIYQMIVGTHITMYCTDGR